MKAVIPAAGLGTRFLPATKAQPKEMLPVVDKPAIQYVIEEAVASGIDDILVVTGRGKRAIEDHFDKAVELEILLEKASKAADLELVRAVSDIANIHYIRQKHQLGLGDAVKCARKHVGNDAFAVMLGDTITMTETPCVRTLERVFDDTNASVIAVERIPGEKTASYGIVATEPLGGNLHKVTGLVEKPDPADAPSDLAIFGRYVLTPEIFDMIEETMPGKNGEVQLTDAIDKLLAVQPVYAFEVTGRRYDIGNKLDWLKATIDLALDRNELREPLQAYLRSLIDKG